MFKIKLANKKLYKANIKDMYLRLSELQELDLKTQKLKKKGLKKS